MITNPINIATFRSLDPSQRAQQLRDVNDGLPDRWLKLETDYKIVDITDKEIALHSFYEEDLILEKDLITEIDPQELKIGQCFKGIEYSNCDDNHRIGQIQFVEFIEEPKPMSEEEAQALWDSLPTTKDPPTCNWKDF